MIGFFPELYDDELFFSALSRYHIRSGNATYRQTAKEFFSGTAVTPDIEFISSLKKEVADLMKEVFGEDKLIMKHTMFPYYSFFRPFKEKMEALDKIRTLQVRSKEHNQKHFRTKKLRHCPVCMREDRELFGETYWHRMHQLDSINICPKHFCNLLESDIEFTVSTVSPAFITAEEANYTFNEESITEREKDFSKYVFNLLNNEELFFDPNFDAVAGIRCCLPEKYKTVRNIAVKITNLSADFNEFYKDINTFSFGTPTQMDKFFHGGRTDYCDYLLMAYFADFQPEIYEQVKKGIKSKKELIDDKIAAMKAEGKKYPEIAREVGLGYSYCKKIGNSIGKVNNTKRKQGKKGDLYDWKKLDEEYLVTVKSVIAQIIQNNKDSRPTRITVAGICKMCGIKDSKCAKLPQCLAEIKKYSMTVDEYWAQKIVWAWSTLPEKNRTRPTQIMRLTNIDRKDFPRSFPYISKFTTEEEARKIIALIQ